LPDQLQARPPPSAYSLAQRLAGIETLPAAIAGLEQRLQEVFRTASDLQRLQTRPGVGFILAVVMASEIGAVRRFARPEEWASSAGTTRRVHASGGKTRYGPLRPDGNRYLKWACVEAANACGRVRRRPPHRPVRPLYERLACPTGHQKAVGAGARHLAEAAFGVLTKQESSRDPRHPQDRGSSIEA
jgi:transposase